MLLWERLIGMGIGKEKTIKDVVERLHEEGKIRLDNAVTVGFISEEEKQEIIGGHTVE